MRAKTGRKFDLPTEVQWEYACKAGVGTVATYNNGGSSESDLKLVGRYSGNTTDGKGGYSEHTTVGSYLPNNWGIYDMHGNVNEWCLDWYKSGYMTSGAIDPVGPTSGKNRVVRGGSYVSAASSCKTTSRGCQSPGYNSARYGFRLCRLLP